MPSPNVVQFECVSKVYRGGFLNRRVVHALRGVSLSIPAGGIFGLLGPNRAGKTTLVKILLSICRPTSGTFRRFGYPGRDRSTLARIGYLHESQAFPRYLSAVGLLEFYGALADVTETELKKRIPRLLELVGLADRTHEPISNFSKGMVQRLALAQALLNEPELLVLDEPTEGMDLTARELIHDVLAQRRRDGKTAILVSHSLADVERLCDRIAVLRRGEVAFEGTLDELAKIGAATSDGSLQGALRAIYRATGDAAHEVAS